MTIRVGMPRSIEQIVCCVRRYLLFALFYFPKREENFLQLSKHTDRIFFDTGLHLHDASASMQARRQGSHGGEGMARGYEGEKGHFSLMQVVMLKLGYRLTRGENNNKKRREKKK